jgi:hypothetical protein
VTISEDVRNIVRRRAKPSLALAHQSNKSQG